MIKSILYNLFFLTMLAGNISGQVPAQTLPAFNFFRPDQSSFTDKDLPKDKMLFLVFFDAGCEHCQRAIKNIGQHYADYKKAIICLVSIDDQDKINRFMNTFGLQLKGKKNVILLQDKLNQFVIKFKPKRYPSMFLYSSEKKLLDYEDNEESMFRFVNIIKKTSRQG